MIRTPVRYLKQWLGLQRVPARPSMDAVDFGTSRCVVLDVGANRGGFAGDVLLRAPLARVHCFEPNANLLPELERKARSFGTMAGAPRCVVVAAAAGDRDEQRTLHVTAMAAASSLLPVAERARSGWPSVDFSEREVQQVAVVHLDSYLAANAIAQVKLLKLDVQGFELHALRGCGERLRDVEYVHCEVQFAPLYDGAPTWLDIVDYLRPFRFKPLVMDGLCFAPDGQPLQADLLFQSTAGRR
jgi:FkbM family methyltransferase